MFKSSAPCPRCGQYFYKFTASNYCESCLNTMKYDKQKGSSNGNIIDTAIIKLLPWILIPAAIIYFVKLYWMYVVSGVIAVICIIACKKIYRKAFKPGVKIAITIFVSIALIVITLSIAPYINGNTKQILPLRTQTPSTQTRYMLVNSDALNVRRGPSADHGIVSQLKKNTRVQILDSSGQWWRIKSGNIEGYVNSSFLINETKLPSASSTSLIQSSSTLMQQEPGYGTTRSHSYQRTWEEASQKANEAYNRNNLPPGLILPNGQTVKEFANSGKVYGK